MNLYSPTLSIGELSQRTGIGVAALRAWERRHGFPVPQRLAGGHRRYSERDVELLHDVQRERAAGVRLEAALAGARRRTVPDRPSAFAALRGALSGATPVTFSARSMLAVSRAIEDETSVRADRAIIFGAFEHERHWRAACRRWRRLATRADLVAAFAEGVVPDRVGRALLVPLEADSPMTQEWAVVCDSPTFYAALAAVEVPPEPRDGPGRRRFEALWTVEPDVVRRVARILASSVGEHHEGIEAVIARLHQPVVATTDVLRTTTTLMNRTLAYLEDGA